MTCINTGKPPWGNKPNPQGPVSCGDGDGGGPDPDPGDGCEDFDLDNKGNCQDWIPGPGICPVAPINPQVVHSFDKGVLDIRWDPPAIIAKNTPFQVVGVNIYRSDTSERGPYVRLNAEPVGGTFYRDFTDNALVQDEIVAWDTAWLARGEQANSRNWVFRTLNRPLVKRGPGRIYANGVFDVLVRINGVDVPVHSVFGPTGEVTLSNVRGYDYVRQAWIEPVLPTPEAEVTVTYRWSKNFVRTDLEGKLWYRITTVARDDKSESGFRETPLEFAEPVTFRSVEPLDYIWREAIRRNNWILEQGGERVKAFIRKTTGKRCFCRRDPRTMEFSQMPDGNCKTCFPAGTEITMEDFTRKPIEQIQVGDRVLTHEGRPRRVYETMQREVGEDLVVVEATHGVGFSSTTNHPVLVIRREDARCIRQSRSLCTGPDSKKICKSKSWKEICAYKSQAKACWVRADSLREGDYLVFRVPEKIPEIPEMTGDRLRVLGYYAAEGHTAKKQLRDGSYSTLEKSTCFAFHTREIPTHVEELQRLLTLEYGAASSIQPVSNTPNGCSLAVSKQAVAEDMLCHVGKYSQHKRLSKDLVWQKPELSLQFLGAYFNGDGWQCLSASRTHLGVSTASYDLARQVEVMLLRQGIVPRFNSRTRTQVPNPGRPGTHQTTEHTVCIRKTDMHVLQGAMEMVSVPPILPGGWAVNLGKMVLYPIRKLSRRLHIGTVFNLEVEEDHSYVAGGAVVHNCYGTGFVGGYEGPYDLIVAPDDADRAVRQGMQGRNVDHVQDVWTGPSPLLSQRDIIVKQTGERYSIGPIRRPTNRGNLMQQHFQMRYRDEQDIIYALPMFDPSEMCWPETRGRPAVTQGGGWMEEGPPTGMWPVGADYQQTPMQTEKDNIPDEREQRGRSPVWENVSYLIPIMFFLDVLAQMV